MPRAIRKLIRYSSGMVLWFRGKRGGWSRLQVHYISPTTTNFASTGRTFCVTRTQYIALLPRQTPPDNLSSFTQDIYKYLHVGRWMAWSTSQPSLRVSSWLWRHHSATIWEWPHDSNRSNIGCRNVFSRRLQEDVEKTWDTIDCDDFHRDDTWQCYFPLGPPWAADCEFQTSSFKKPTISETTKGILPTTKSFFFNYR